MEGESTRSMRSLLRKHVIMIRGLSEQESDLRCVRDISKHLAYNEDVTVSGKDSLAKTRSATSTGSSSRLERRWWLRNGSSLRFERCCLVSRWSLEVRVESVTRRGV